MATLIPPRTERTLPAYKQRRTDSMTVSLMVALAIVYAFVSGYFIGVFQQYILQQFLLPLLALAGLALWAMPAREGVTHRVVERGFFALIDIGQVSCRQKMGKYGLISVVAVS